MPTIDESNDFQASDVRSSSEPSTVSFSEQRFATPPSAHPSATIPQWKLPTGVSRATWDYVTTDRIADDYDDYFEFNDLFEFDVQTIVAEIGEPGRESPEVVADFGMGTGRALLPLLRQGFHGLGIDLSSRMLEIAAEKASRESLPLQCVRANLVELDGIAAGAAQHGICLFSTLGMIRGGTNRQQTLQHFRRIIRPGGKLVMHVHNLWFNLYDPGGPWWLIKNRWASLFSNDLELGDKYFPYRGLPAMYLHVFRRRELRRLLQRAGFERSRFISLHQTRQREIKIPWLLSDLRANGWLIVSQ